MRRILVFGALSAAVRGVHLGRPADAGPRDDPRTGMRPWRSRLLAHLKDLNGLLGTRPG